MQALASGGHLCSRCCEMESYLPCVKSRVLVPGYCIGGSSGLNPRLQREILRESETWSLHREHLMVLPATPQPSFPPLIEGGKRSGGTCGRSIAHRAGLLGVGKLSIPDETTSVHAPLFGAPLGSEHPTLVSHTFCITFGACSHQSCYFCKASLLC